MSAYQYRLVAVTMPAKGKEKVHYYGLRITEKSSEKPAAVIPALSTDKAAVKRLKNTLEENGVSPCHVRDLWEDMMYEGAE